MNRVTTKRRTNRRTPQQVVSDKLSKVVDAFADLLDVQVLSEPSEDMDGNGYRYTLYALGTKQELAAGIRGGHITPYFNSVDALGEYLVKYSSVFHKIAIDYMDSDNALPYVNENGDIQP